MHSHKYCLYIQYYSYRAHIKYREIVSMQLVVVA
nr:MAG TPA: hypothetical protein [Caudoviricetes sp.]